MVELTIEVSDEKVAAEVAYALLGRATDIHSNPDDQFEETAIELRDIGQELLEQYE